MSIATFDVSEFINPMGLSNKHHQQDGWSQAATVEPNSRVHLVGNFVVFLLWAGGMALIYMLLMQACDVKSYQPSANRQLSVPASSLQRGAAASSASNVSLKSAGALVFNSKASFIDFLDDHFSASELQAAYENAVSSVQQVALRVIKVRPKESAGGQSFSNDFHLELE